jgi:hypothetical protein
MIHFSVILTGITVGQHGIHIHTEAGALAIILIGVGMLVTILFGVGIHPITVVTMAVITAEGIGTMVLEAGVIRTMLETIGTDITTATIMVTIMGTGMVMEITMVLVTTDLHVKVEET